MPLAVVFTPSRIADALVAAAHAAALVLAACVPLFAIASAIVAAASGTPGESLADLVDPARWWRLLSNTAAVCALGVAVAGTLGGILGLLLARTDVYARRAMLAFALLAACVPAYAVLVFGFSMVPLEHVCGSVVICGLLYGLLHTPIATLLLGFAFAAVDRDIEDLARLDAGAGRVLRRVTIPAAGWAWGVLAIVLSVLIATDAAVSDLLLVRTFSQEVYTQYALQGRRVGPVLTGLPILVALILLLLLLCHGLRHRAPASEGGFGERVRLYGLGTWRAITAVLLATAGILTVGWPTVRLLGRIDGFASFLDAAWGVRWELLNSTWLAAAGATLVVLPAAGLATALARGGWQRWAVAGAVVLLLATPAPVAGVSLKLLLNRPGVLGAIHDHPAVVAVGYFVRFLPFGVLLLLPAVQRIPREVEWAARVDGCGWAGTVMRIRWPAATRDAALAWLVVAILSFAEVGTSILLESPGWPLAATQAFRLVHASVYGDLAVLALLSVICMLVPWLALVILLRRPARRFVACTRR